MARKLPWAQYAQSKSVKTLPTTSTKASAQHDLSSPTRAPRSGRNHCQSRKRSRSRSRSTSPPPGPPTVEPMIEGSDGDDIWMIVEDEFQSVAQSFTAHLHHAEYKKRVLEARSRPRNTFPTATQPMSQDARRRLQKDVLHDQQQNALAAVGTGSRTAASDDNIEDPWRGTSIAGLIASGVQEKKSLRGLDRIPSSTRAAQGFHRQGSNTQPASSPPEPQRRQLERGSQTVLEATSNGRAKKQATFPAEDYTAAEQKSIGRIRHSSHTTMVSSEPNDNDEIPFPSTAVRETKRAKTEKRLSTTFLERRSKAESEEQKAQRLEAIPMFLM
jgi:hypothetical protein